MSYNNGYAVPSFLTRILSVWYRHFRVYASNFLSNAFPPFLEPLILLGGLGLGIGVYIPDMEGISYVLFLASGLIVTSAMYASSYECTYGTFIRLEFDAVYDGMLGAPLSPKDLLIGEILFVGSKGLFFSFAVLSVLWALGIITYPLSIFTIFVGFICGAMFGSLSLVVTSFVRNINHFNFYFTGILMPMFYFSGVIFSIENLPQSLRYLAEFIPLTHVVRLTRGFCIPDRIGIYMLYDLLYCIIMISLTAWIAIRRLKKRMIV